MTRRGIDALPSAAGADLAPAEAARARASSPRGHEGLAHVRAVREAVPELPVPVGSGVTPEQLPALAAQCDGLVVGSWLERDGGWRKPVERERAAHLRDRLA